MFKSFLNKHSKSAFFIIEMVSGATFIWPYIAIYYELFRFFTKFTIATITAYIIVLMLTVFVGKVFGFAERARKECIVLSKRIQNISENNRITFFSEWLTKDEQRYIKQSNPCIHMKKFLLWMSLLFFTGILHIGYLWLSGGDSSFGIVFLLFTLFVCIFCISLNHYMVIHWKYSSTILKKWQNYNGQ